MRYGCVRVSKCCPNLPEAVAERHGEVGIDHTLDDHAPVQLLYELMPRKVVNRVEPSKRHIVCFCQIPQVGTLRCLEVGGVVSVATIDGQHPEDGSATVVEHDDQQWNLQVTDRREGTGIVQKCQISDKESRSPSGGAQRACCRGEDAIDAGGSAVGKASGRMKLRPAKKSEITDGKGVGGYDSPLIREFARSEEHTSELQSRGHLVCRLLLEKKKSTRRSKLSDERHDAQAARRRRHEQS